MEVLVEVPPPLQLLEIPAAAVLVDMPAMVVLAPAIIPEQQQPMVVLVPEVAVVVPAAMY